METIHFTSEILVLRISVKQCFRPIFYKSGSGSRLFCFGESGCGSRFFVNPDRETRSRILKTKNCAKNLSEKLKFLYQIAIYIFFGIREGLSIIH
jgi:hypothetical protein